MPTKTWPKLPKPIVDDGGFHTESVNEVPMADRRPSGEAPTYDSPRIDPTECKHGKGSCGECGTTNRRDAVHRTEGGLGAVGKLRKRRR